MRPHTLMRALATVARRHGIDAGADSHSARAGAGSLTGADEEGGPT